jgi:putative oxidoreductase
MVVETNVKPSSSTVAQKGMDIMTLTSTSRRRGLIAGNADAGLLLLRLALGIVFVMHGWQKATEFGLSGLSGSLASLGIPFPSVNAALLIATELGGGLAMLAGVFARFAGVALAFAMTVATITVHLPNGFFLPNGYEFTLTLFFASLAIAAAGAGKYSADALLFRRPVRPGEVDGEPGRIAA